MKHINKEEREHMLDLAYQAMERAYTPYSHFQVGACLKGAGGKYYLGCNIENASYTPTNCAERTAVFDRFARGSTASHSGSGLGLALAKQFIARGDRVLLLVTGKPPRPESKRPHARGAIRAAIGDWLAASRHAHAIASVRGAHPRHGGAGALYIVLRRPRLSGKS